VRSGVDGHDWVQISGPVPRYELHVGATTFVIVQRDDGQWRAGMIEPDGSKTVLVNAGGLEWGQRSTEARAKALIGSPWRRLRATVAQRERAEQLKIEIDPGATKGEVSDMLSARLAELQRRRN